MTDQPCHTGPAAHVCAACAQPTTDDDEIPTGDAFMERYYTPELLGEGDA